jgi:hypothetical protein
MSNLARLEAYCADTVDANGTLNAAEWLSQADESDQPLMDGVFDQGDRVAIVAQSKARKSFFALQIATCAAAGKDFLGFKLEPQRVLLVNGEVKPTNYKRRLRKLTEKLEILSDQLGSLEFLNTRAMDAEDVTLSSILSLCRHREITMCILDPFYMYIGNEIDQEQVKSAVAEMKRFSQHGITLVSVFHATKGLIGDRQTIDRISGSGIFARDADALLSLSVHENKTSVVLSFALRNYAEPECRTIDFDDGAFVDSDLAPVELTSRSRPRREYRLEDAAACVLGEMSYIDAYTAMMTTMSCGRDKAKDLLVQCHANGLLGKQVRGKYTFYSPKATQTDVTQPRLTRTNQTTLRDLACPIRGQAR